MSSRPAASSGITLRFSGGPRSGPGSSLTSVDTRVLRCTPFVVNRRLVSDRRVQPIVIVVLHIAPQVLSEFGDPGERAAVSAFGFQRVEEGLHVRVLVGGAAARHALGNAAAGELVPHGGPDEFAPAVAVKDQVMPWSTASQGGGERPLSKPRIACGAQPPGQHPSRILIEDDHQIPSAPRRGQIREVTHPDLVRAGRPGPSHPIRMLPEPTVHAGGPPIDPHGPAAPAADAHQSLDPSATQPIPPCRQGSMEARTPVRPALRSKIARISSRRTRSCLVRPLTGR